MMIIIALMKMMMRIRAMNFFIFTVIIFDCYLEACLIAGRFGSQF